MLNTIVGMFSICVSIAYPKMIVCITGTTSMKNSVVGCRRIWTISFSKTAQSPVKVPR